MKARKSKPQISAGARRHERWHCPRYEDCLEDAAHRNLACVPCRGCPQDPGEKIRKGPKKS